MVTSAPLALSSNSLALKKQTLTNNRLRFLLALPNFILAIVLVLLLFGSGFYLIFNPLSLLTRTSTVVLYPLLDKLARLIDDLLYLFKPVQGAVDTVTTFLSGKIIFQKPLPYQLQMVILVLFLTLILVSYWIRRFWCRHLCPLSALLDWFSRFSFWGRVVDPDASLNAAIVKLLAQWMQLEKKVWLPIKHVAG